MSPFRFAAFAVVYAVWTTLLLVPIPGFVAEAVSNDPNVRFYVAKTLHVTVFAFLTVLGLTAVAVRSAGGFSWRCRCKGS